MSSVESTAGARIKALSAVVASQIAAGEVVERPASVVKELVENAIDAGARRITIDLAEGGIELIRITDDGGGIDPDDLPLAIAPHATSKISDTSDLDRIGTLGFRGEALASIASVSRLSIRSRPPSQTGAHTIETEGDTVGTVKPDSGPPGTCVTVRTLFFNTPARRKFLKSVQTEQARSIDAVREIAMAHPGVGFTLTADGKRVIDVPAGQTVRTRIVELLGRELEGELLDVGADEFDDPRGIVLWGLAGRPSIARATARAQHVFVNGRAVRDRTIQHAVSEAYRGIIEPNRYPTVVLMLSMNPDSVDVNVHPAKSEVRFRESSLVHSAVLHAVRRSLQGADLTPSTTNTGFGRLAGSSIGFGAGGDRAILPEPKHGSAAPGFSGGPGLGGVPPQGFFNAARVPTQERLSFPVLRDVMSDRTTIDAAPVWSSATPRRRILQVHKSYVVVEDPDGILIVDQHALHERVMFEQLLERVTTGAGGALESQRLLAPAIVDASPTQIARLDDLKPLLDRIGIDLAPMGVRQVGVHAFPSFLFSRGVEPGPFVTDLLDRTDSGRAPADAEDLLRDVLDMMACKAAVKAGDRLSEDELLELLALREHVERSSNCPHGRPTSIRLTLRELERLFGRA